jgi:hypothetical protein
VLLARLQRLLGEIYDVPTVHDVRDFVVTDPEATAALSRGPSDEQLLVAESEGMIEMSLFVDRDVLTRLDGDDPLAALTQDNLADYLTALEGVSHFVYVAWNAAHDKPVSLLELELQAEIDKYVSCAWLMVAQGAGRFPPELHRALFERTAIVPELAGDRAAMYRAATRYAARYCRRIAAAWCRRGRAAPTDMLAELRRFYRWGAVHKLAHIERYA